MWGVAWKETARLKMRCTSWRSTSSSNLICFLQIDFWRKRLIRKDPKGKDEVWNAERLFHYCLCGSYPVGEGGLWIVWLNSEWRKMLEKKKVCLKQSLGQWTQRNGGRPASTRQSKWHIRSQTNHTTFVHTTVPPPNATSASERNATKVRFAQLSTQQGSQQVYHNW